MIKHQLVKTNLGPVKYLFYLLTGICLLLIDANIIKLIGQTADGFSLEVFYNLISYIIYFMFLLLVANGLRSYSKIHLLQPETVTYLNWLKFLVPVLTVLQIGLAAYNINASHFILISNSTAYTAGYRAGFYSGACLKQALLPNMGFIVISALLVLLANTINYTVEIKEEQALTI